MYRSVYGPTYIEGGILDQMQVLMILETIRRRFLFRVTEVILNLFLQSGLVHSNPIQSHFITLDWELMYQ